MKILITGGSGFIGSHVVRAALAAGHEVVNVDALTYAAAQGSLADVEGHDKYDFICADICDELTIDAVIMKTRPNAIIHLAAETHVDKSIDGAADFIETNVTGTRVMLDMALTHWRNLEGAARDSFRFLHVSTDEVYGDLGPDDPAFTENTPYAPSSPYSASKAASDHLARAWQRTYGLPVIISNCSNNYGPNQFPEKLIPLVILRALAGKPIPVYGKGENIRDWLYVGDHAQALLRILHEGRPAETYNIGGETEMSNLGLVKKLCSLLDELSPRPEGTYADLIRFVTDRPGHDRRYAMNIDKIRRELGWQPATTLSDGLRQTVRWYLDNEDWWRPLVESRQATRRQGQA